MTPLGVSACVSAAIRMLVKQMPKHTAQWLGEILAPVWNTLTSSAELYVRSHINDLEQHNDPSDSDGTRAAGPGRAHKRLRRRVGRGRFRWD